MREKLVPVVLLLVAVMVWLTRSTPPLVQGGVIRAGADLVDAKAFVDGVGELRG